MSPQAHRTIAQPLIGFGDSRHIDAFGRLRTADPETIWDSQFEYNAHPLFYDNTTANNGTISHNAAHSAVDVNVATDNGSKAILQSFEYFRYQPGKSQQIAITFVMADATAGLDQRIGQFDDENGFFLEQSGSTISMVRRTKTSGSVVNNKATKGSGDAGVDASGVGWNIDQMDGEGPSAIILDLTKGQILHIDYQWLSTGRIRFGFDTDGQLHYAHAELLANVLTVPSTTTANLPVRWEMVNTAIIAGARTMEAICVSITSEGGQNLQTGHPFEFDREGATAADNIEEAFIGIRAATTLNSIAFHGKIQPLRFSLLVSSADCHWRLRYAPTTLTDVSWQAPVTHSAVQTDIATTAIAGGIVIDGGFTAAGQGQQRGEVTRDAILRRLPLTLDADGTQTLSLFLTIEGVGGTTTVSGSLGWEEIR